MLSSNKQSKTEKQWKQAKNGMDSDGSRNKNGETGNIDGSV